jgi:hypothetical protein
MANTTFQGVVRSYGGGSKGTHTPGVMTQSVQISFDPTESSATNVRIGTSATSGETLVLPAGAIPISIMTIGGATGGTNPTVDIGTSTDDDGLFNEVDADTKGTVKGADGALAVAGGLAADATVTGKVGASAATGGTYTGILTYVMANNGVE